MKIWSCLLASPPRPVLAGDGVSLAKEQREGCDQKEVLMDDLERMARINVQDIEGLRNVARNGLP